jgi:hypothetical protein
MTQPQTSEVEFLQPIPSNPFVCPTTGAHFKYGDLKSRLKKLLKEQTRRSTGITFFDPESPKSPKQVEFAEESVS